MKRLEPVALSPSMGTKEIVRRILNEAEAARYLSVSQSWLRQLRQLGGGPAYHKLGRRVGYATEDLDEWLAARRIAKYNEILP